MDAANGTVAPAVNTTPCLNDYCVSIEDYLAMIEAYIFPTYFEWVLIALYIIAIIVGLSGNFLVCFAVWRNQQMRTVTNLFIVNLAVADFLVILICLPPTVLGDVTETWYMGSVMCKIVQYLQVRELIHNLLCNLYDITVMLYTTSCLSQYEFYYFIPKVEWVSFTHIRSDYRNRVGVH